MVGHVVVGLAGILGVGVIGIVGLRYSGRGRRTRSPTTGPGTSGITVDHRHFVGLGILLLGHSVVSCRRRRFLRRRLTGLCNSIAAPISGSTVVGADG